MFEFNQKQVEKLSDIFEDIGLVVLASVVIPSFLDRFNLHLILLGLGITSLFWYLSLLVRR